MQVVYLVVALAWYLLKVHQKRLAVAFIAPATL